VRRHGRRRRITAGAVSADHLDTGVGTQPVGVAQDGGFGPATEQAVKNWQVAHQLPADGQAGSQTMSRMGIVRSTCSAPPRAPSPVPPAQSSTAQAQWDLGDC